MAYLITFKEPLGPNKLKVSFVWDGGFMDSPIEDYIKSDKYIVKKIKKQENDTTRTT
jgi:hypothetical protein